MPLTEDKICGIREVYRPPDKEAEVDIVAVHGLNGDALRTWTSRKNGVCWLSHPEFLPKYIKNARVLVWGYNSSFASMTGAEPSSNKIHHHAQTLVAQLYADRKLEERMEKPIIFVCHSLGGLVVKRALSYSNSRPSGKISHLHTIFTCTYGILFFGTPHRGSAKAGLLLSLQRVTSRIFPRVFGRVEKSLVKALQVESETVQNITDHFTPIMKNFHIHFFWEQEKTNLRYSRSYIVEEDSAAPTYDDTERSGIPADHSGMVKFDESTSSSFRLVAETLQRYCETAAEVIKQRPNNSSEQRAEGLGPQSPSELSRRTTYLPPYKHSLPLTQHATDPDEALVNFYRYKHQNTKS